MGEKLEIIEELYPGRKWYVFKIQTHNPWGKIFSKFHKMVFHILEISASKFYEQYLMVDDSFVPKGDTNIGFRWYFKYKKPFDEYANFVLETKLVGKQDQKTNEGMVEFKFRPYVEVKFEYANFLQRKLIDAYWYIYYRKRVDKLKLESKNLFEKLVDEIKAEFGVNAIEPKLLDAWRETF